MVFRKPGSSSAVPTKSLHSEFFIIMHSVGYKLHINFSHTQVCGSYGPPPPHPPSSSSSSSWPGAYASDAPQPRGILCYPFLDIPTFATSPSSSSVQPERPLVAKGATAWARLPCYILGILYMPQIYDMGPTALLPLRRKAC